MLLVLDVGNTSVTHAFYANGQLRESGHVLHKDIAAKSSQWFKKTKGELLEVATSSVVPGVTKKLKQTFKAPSARLWIAGENLPLSIKSKYQKGQYLGIDRKVAIYGALKLYKPPFLIIDFGTAITMDYVSSRGIFEGGLIIPGPELSFQALIHKAALISDQSRLPVKASTFPGTSTQSCMAAGVLYGYGEMADGLINRFKHKYGSMRVIATGGFAKTLKPYTRNLKFVDPLLTLKSLALLARNHPNR